MRPATQTLHGPNGSRLHHHRLLAILLADAELNRTTDLRAEQNRAGIPLFAQGRQPVHTGPVLFDEQMSPEQVDAYRRMPPERRLALAKRLYWTARANSRLPGFGNATRIGPTLKWRRRSPASSPMSEPELSLLFIRPLNQIGTRYIVSGSIAAIIYGERRLTHDVDFVIHSNPENVRRFPEVFS